MPYTSVPNISKASVCIYPLLPSKIAHPGRGISTNNSCRAIGKFGASYGIIGNGSSKSASASASDITSEGDSLIASIGATAGAAECTALSGKSAKSKIGAGVGCCRGACAAIGNGQVCNASNGAASDGNTVGGLRGDGAKA